jgi:hypothetical protein
MDWSRANRLPPAELILSPPVGMQLFMQFIAAVSQLIWHMRVVVFSDGGVIGTGFTV